MLRICFKPFLVICCALTSLMLGACTEKPEDEIIAQYERGEAAIASNNALELRYTRSTDSIAMYQRILADALDASVAQTKALPPTSMELVLALRSRVPATELRRMTVETFLQWMVDEEFLSLDADYGIVAHSARISGDIGVLQLGFKVERQRTTRGFGRRGRGIVGAIASASQSSESTEAVEGLTYNFIRTDGYWYIDDVANFHKYDAVLKDAASEEKLSLPDYLFAAEKESNKSLRPTIWAPVGR
jgi:hypothetical protein